MSSTIKKEYSSSEIVDEIRELIHIFVSPNGKVLTTKFIKRQSEKPFTKIKHMIGLCRNLEEPTRVPTAPYYYETYIVFHVLAFEYTGVIDILDFLTRDRIGQPNMTEEDALLFREEYEKVIIYCIKVYLFDKKYEYNNKHFFVKVKELCNSGHNEIGHEVIPNIITLLQKTKDKLLTNENFTSLCDPIKPTNAYYAGPPVAIRTRHTNFPFPYSVSAIEVPRDLTPVYAVEAPLYINQHTRQPVYDIPMTWPESYTDRITYRSRYSSRPRSRSRSRSRSGSRSRSRGGGKRKPKNNTRKIAEKKKRIKNRYPV